jgi:hypothetical protein
MPPKAKKKKGKAKKAAVALDPYEVALKEKTLQQLDDEVKNWEEKCKKQMRMRSLALCDRV